MRYLAVLLTAFCAAGHVWLAPSAFARFDAEPDLTSVLRRAAEYTADYHARLSSMVAEEQYVQRTRPALSSSGSASSGRSLDGLRDPGNPVPPRVRVLKSDFGIV